MRYGSANAEPAGLGVVFPDESFMGVEGVPGVEVGGSICVGTEGIAGGGRAGIAASGDDVSTVMFLVTTGDFRRVYMIGEHLIAMDGFLCPGR